MFILWWIVVGLIVGFISGLLMKGDGFGAIVDVVFGIVGAVIGGLIMRLLGYVGPSRQVYTMFVVITGAALLTMLLRKVAEMLEETDISW